MTGSGTCKVLQAIIAFCVSGSEQNSERFLSTKQTVEPRNPRDRRLVTSKSDVLRLLCDAAVSIRPGWAS